MIVQIGGKIVDKEFFAFVLRVFGDDWAVEVENKHLHLASLPRLPEIARNVEEESLKEEDETHPLVVLVIFDGIAFLLVANSRVRNITTDHFGTKSIGDGECRVDPAVGVHDITRNALYDTVDRVTNVLARCHYQRESDQHNNGRFVVKTKNVVVDIHRV